tara:strand:- start:14 stop:403 length:390 start_codon:yes stop_codon:yes gene_type:complete
MGYFYSKRLKVSFQETEDKVRNALLDVGFGVLTEINIKDAFKEKLGINHKNYKILGACNPKLAHEAINNEINIGILMPCNIVIIDNEDETTEVVFPKAAALLDVTNNNHVMNLSKQVDSILKEAFNNIN